MTKPLTKSGEREINNEFFNSGFWSGFINAWTEEDGVVIEHWQMISLAKKIAEFMKVNIARQNEKKN